MKKIIMTFLAASMTTTSLFAASFEEQSKAVSSIVASVKQIASLDLSCNTKADCVALAVGSRACGGANGYVVASKKSPYFATAESLATTSESAEEVFNRLNEVFSICSIEMEPEVSCLANKCTELRFEPMPAM